MPNAVEHNGKVYILNPEPKGDYAERVGAPHLNQALNDFGIQTVAPNSYGATTNATAAKALATGNPNLTGVNFRTEFDKIELLEVKLPAGMSAEDGVKALNNYDPKTQTYTDKKLSDELIRKKTEGLTAKSVSNANDITRASGISPHATVTEQLMVNAEKIDKAQYIVTQQGTSFTVESRIDGQKMTVGASVDPKFPDRVELQISASGYDDNAKKFKQAIGEKLLDGVLKDNKASTITAAVDFVNSKKIVADITPEKAKKVADARLESAKGTLIGQNATDKIGQGLLAEKVETIAPGVRENPSRVDAGQSGGNTLEDLLQRSGKNDPLYHQQMAADEILHARTIAKVEALREAGHIPQDVSAEEVVKKAGQGQTFNQLKETGQRIGDFKNEVRNAMDSLPESRGSFLDRMAEAERIATGVIAERDFKKGITILQQSNPHLAAMSEAEIKSLASGLQDAGKPVSMDSFTEAAKQYRTYLDTHTPASTGNAFSDILNASDPAIKRAALDHAVSGGNTAGRMGNHPVQGPSLLDEIINRSPDSKIVVPAVEVERTPRVATDADRAFVNELLKSGMANMPQTPQPSSAPIHIKPESPRVSGGGGGGTSAPSRTSGATSFTNGSSPTSIGPQNSPTGPVMSAVSNIGGGVSANAGTSHLIDQTAPAMGHAEVLGATALKPKVMEDLRPDIRETPVVTQVARPNAPAANEPIHTPSKLTQAATQAPLAGINTSAPAANAESFAPRKPAVSTPVAAAIAVPVAAPVVATPTPTPTLRENPTTPAHGGGGGGGSIKLDGRSHVAGSGVGAGMGVYSLTNKLGADGSAAEDLRNKDTRKLAQAGIIADVAAITVDTADGLAALQKVSKGLSTASKVSRAAAPVAAVLGVASGAVDYKIAVIKGDAGKASAAIGGAAGGMVGAAAGGIVGAKAGAAAGAAIGALFGGVGAVPGAAVGAFFGGIAGAIGGAFAGGEAGKKVADATLKESFQRKFDEDRRLAAAAAAATAKPTVIASAPTSAPATVKPSAAPTASPVTTVAATSAPAKPAASSATTFAAAPVTPAATKPAITFESLYPTTTVATATPAPAKPEREPFKTAPDVGNAFVTATAKAQENRGPALSDPTIVAANNKAAQNRVM